MSQPCEAVCGAPSRARLSCRWLAAGYSLQPAKVFSGFEFKFMQPLPDVKNLPRSGQELHPLEALTARRSINSSLFDVIFDRAGSEL